MSLDATTIAAMRAAFAASPMATTVVVAIKSGDTFGSNQTIAAMVSTFKRGQVYSEIGRSQKIVNSILVRPIADTSGTVKLGDRVTYASEVYTIVEIQNTAIAGWVCEHSERVAVTRGESFRAEGGGS